MNCNEGGIQVTFLPWGFRTEIEEVCWPPLVLLPYTAYVSGGSVESTA